MSSTAVATGAPTAEVPRVAQRRTRFARPPEWLWALSIGLQVASAAALTAYTYYFLDDWYFIAQARRVPFSITYLRMGLFEHFSPISRALDKLLVYNSTGNFTLAHSLELAMYAAAVAAFAFVMRTILGNRWWALALTVLFGQSLFLMRLLHWWTATANILPSTIFGLVAFGAYLRWQRGGSRAWMIVSLAGLLGALLDYETAILLPVFILIVRLLVIEDELRPRAWLTVLRREWPMWAGYALLDAAALVNFYTWYYQPFTRPSLSRVLDFLVDSILGTFIPALFGIKHPQAALGRQSAVVIACVVVFVALIAYLVYTRPWAGRCVLAFVLIASIDMLAVGIPRVGRYGVGAVGSELYYQQALQFMFLILVALALRAERRRPPPAALAAGLRRLRAPAAAASLLVLGTAVYGALYVTSVHAMATWLRGTTWDPARSRSYVRTFQASVRRVTERAGREPVLFNAQVPDGVFSPEDSYAIYYPMIDSGVRIGPVAHPIYAVRHSGVLQPISFRASVAGVLAHAMVLEHGRPAVAALMRGGSACIGPSPHAAWLRVPLSGLARLNWSNAVQTGHRLPEALRLFLRMPYGSKVRVASRGRWHSQIDQAFGPTFARGISGQYVPLDMNSRARAIELKLPAGACVTSLAVGSFTPSKVLP
jgi:hypothetical protein